MKDGQVSISVGCAIAWTLWALSVTTLIMGVAFSIRDVAAVAIVTAVAAATATMRCYFVSQNRIIRGYAKLILDSQDPQTVASLIPVR